MRFHGTGFGYFYASTDTPEHDSKLDYLQLQKYQAPAAWVALVGVSEALRPRLQFAADTLRNCYLRIVLLVIPIAGDL